MWRFWRFLHPWQARDARRYNRACDRAIERIRAERRTQGGEGK